jgi:hypothetical protein
VGREWILVGVIVVVVLLVLLTGKRPSRKHESTVGHYDPNAIGQYRLDPATQSYRYELPILPRSGVPVPPGSGPPHRRRRRRAQPGVDRGDEPAPRR